MKKVMMLWLTSLFIQVTEAQTWDEWFKQNKTQIKYYVEQIGQLQVQIGQLKKGYELVRQGWSTIQQIKSGEFNIHNAFFTSLKNVSPVIKEFAGAAELVARQVKLYRQYRELIASVGGSGVFTEEEISLFYEAFTRLIDQMIHTLDELARVTTSGTLQMTDDERLRRVNALRDESIRQESDFIKMETAATRTVLLRSQEAVDIELLRQWHGIPRQ